MSPEPDGTAAMLQYEYETLSAQASTLAITLARRRADVALKRAEAATLAVSLDSAKELINDLLRKEVLIKTKAPPSPKLPATSQKDSIPLDPALFRALEGQLEVTAHAAEAAVQRKHQIEKEIQRLSKVTVPPALEESNRADSRTRMPLPDGDEPATTTLPAGAERILGAEDPSPSLPPQLDITLSQKKRKARQDTEVSLLRMLEEGTETNSSFRFDHARIWRDVTMPNLALIPKRENAAASDVTLGVVIERIFEGVTCFTPTAGAKNSAASATDFRIDASGTIRKANEKVAKNVASHFGVLTVGAADDCKRVRVVAPAVALARIMDLISDVDSDKCRKPLSRLSLDSKLDARAKTDSTEMGRSPGGRERRVDVDKLPPVAVKLSSPSHVLHTEHIQQIMAVGVPKRFHENGLRLLYSTNEHGMSLLTLYNRAKATSPTLLAIRDTKDRVFGCYAAAPWKSSSTRYYGTGESFVFGTNGPGVAKVYKWSRANSFFQFTSQSFLAIGGGAGSHFALWVDEDLLMGTTSACRTFESPPLTDISDEESSNCTEFKIVALEVWAFDAHVSH